MLRLISGNVTVVISRDRLFIYFYYIFHLVLSFLFHRPLVPYDVVAHTIHQLSVYVKNAFFALLERHDTLIDTKMNCNKSINKNRIPSRIIYIM